MSCLTPLTVMRPREEWMPNNEFSTSSRVVPCGSCPECLKQRQKDWIFRLQYEQKQSQSSCFLTLTYEEAPMTENGLMTLRYQDVQKFLKRLRLENPNRQLKYYCVGEYGTQGLRPHYHLILFNVRHYLLERKRLVLDIWRGGSWKDAQPGIIQIDACTSGSIGYVCGYLNKGKHTRLNGLPFNDDRQPMFSKMSKGLGANYLTDKTVNYYKKKLEPYLITQDGIKQRIPRYYKDKMFSDQEKAIISEKAKTYLNEKLDDCDQVKEVLAKKNIIQNFERRQKLNRKSL